MPRQDQNYGSYDGEDQPSNLLGQYNEDADIHPNDLSGDEQGQQSVFASSLDDIKANFFLTTMTIVKTVIGSGILAIPYTMAKMGYVFGIIVFILAGSVAQYGSVLLLKAKNLSHHSNLSTIFYEIWRSKIAKSIGSIVIFLNNIGVCIAELIIFKQSIRKIFEDVLGKQHSALQEFYTQGWFIVLIVALAETPPTLVSKMEKLKFMALAGVTGICIFMVSFVIFFIFAVADENPLNNPAGNMNLFPENWFKAASSVPNLMLALSYQVNMFPIYKGMRNVSDRKYLLASATGIGFCVFSYLLVGILGYDYAGFKIEANFLNSLSYQKINGAFFFTINFFFLISIFFAFPIMFFGCRNNFIALMKLALLKDSQLKSQKIKGGNDVEEISSYMNVASPEEKKKKARYHFIAYTIGIYAVIIGLSLALESIESVFNIIGAICSTSISILMPTFFYVKLTQMRKQPKTFKYYLSIVLFCVMGPYALFSIIALYIDI